MNAKELVASAGEAVAGLRVVLAGDAHEAMVAISEGTPFVKAWNELDGKTFRATPPDPMLQRVVEADAVKALRDALWTLRDVVRYFWDDDNSHIGELDSACEKADAALAAARKVLDKGVG